MRQHSSPFEGKACASISSVFLALPRFRLFVVKEDHAALGRMDKTGQMFLEIEPLPQLVSYHDSRAFRRSLEALPRTEDHPLPIYRWLAR